jgi:hypothetical protein
MAVVEQPFGILGERLAAAPTPELGIVAGGDRSCRSQFPAEDLTHQQCDG